MMTASLRRLALLSLLVSLPIAAATRTWTGPYFGNWSDPANWGGTAPVANDDLVFPVSGSLTLSVNDFPAGTAFHSITATASEVTGNLVDLGAGGLSLNDGRIRLPLRLAAPQTWSSSGGALITGGIQLNGMALTLANSDSVFGIIGGGIIRGSGSITKVGTGGWSLSADSTFSGPVTAVAGEVNAGRPTALGVGDDTDANGTIILSGSTLDLSGVGGTSVALARERITVFGNGSNGYGAIQSVNDSSIDGTIFLGDANVVIAPGGRLSLNGLVTGPGTLGVGGLGAVVLNRTGNDFTGGVRWDLFAAFGRRSTLSIAADNALPVTSSLDIPANGILEIDGHAQTIASIAGGGELRLLNGATLTLTSPSNTRFSGRIAGSGNIALTGGAITFSNPNDLPFTGTASNTGGVFGVESGTLAVPYIQTAGALALMNLSTIGDVTLSGGELRSIPTTSITARTGSLTLAPSVRQFETIAGNNSFSRIGVTGTVTLNNATLILDGMASVITPGQTFVIIENDGSDPVVGTFAGLPQGALIVDGPGGMNYTITYTGGDGNDVALTAVAPIAAAIPALDPRVLAILAVMLCIIGLLLQRR